jgi:CHASE2 domain-containing sensor protein
MIISKIRDFLEIAIPFILENINLKSVWKYPRKMSDNLILKNIRLITVSFVILFILLVNTFGLLENLSLSTLDLFYRNKPNEVPDSRIILVEITEEDIQRFQNYPFTNEQWIKILSTIESGEPTVIGFDVFRDFSIPKNDRSLDNFLASRNNVIGITKLDPEGSRTVKAPVSLASRDLIGDVNAEPDRDRVLRRAYLWTYPETYPEIPNFGLKLALEYLKRQKIEPTSDRDGYLRLGKVSLANNSPNFGDYRTEDGSGYQILINWRKPLHDFPTYSITTVLSPSFNPRIFQDRIVIIGVGNRGVTVTDLHPSPLDEFTPGIIHQAQLISSIISAVLDGRSLMKSWSDWQENFWLIAWLVGFNFLFWEFAPKRSFLLFIALFALLILSIAFLWIHAYLNFILNGYWIPVIPLSIALPFLYFVNWAVFYLRQLLEENERLATERESARDFIIDNEIYESLARVGANLASEVHDSITEFDNNYNTLNSYINLLKASLSQFLSDNEDKNYSNLFNTQIQNIIVPLTNCKVNFNNILFRLSFLPNADSLLPKESYGSYEDFKALTRNIVIATVRANQSKFPFLEPLDNRVHFRVEEIAIPSRSFRTAHYVQIVAILLNNAITALSYKRSDDDSEPRVDLIVGTRDNWLTITVTDNGVGLPAGVPPRSLLGKFVTRWPEPNKRMGNELYRCKELVDRNYGTIELLADGARTRVEVALFLSR